MKITIVLVTFIILWGISTTSAEPVFFPRRPALSPDGATVVFSFQGDLWSVAAEGGQAIRLTAHPGYDRDPVFSPDGTQLVFASDRYDQYDLFVIPSAGGAPTRLTYASTPDIPHDWTRDGKTILFSSRRLFDYPMMDQIQRIPATGGAPLRLADFFADEVSISPNGKSYLFTCGENLFGRIGYRGSLQSDIWYWIPGKDPVKIIDSPGYDSDPMWGAEGTTIYWRGEDDETKAFNIWRMNLDGSSKKRLTSFTTEGVRNAKISLDGRRIVFEADTDLYLLETKEGAKAKKIPIEVAADLIENPVEVKNFTSEADEIALSDNGEELALVVHGEIVLVSKELGGRATVPLPDPARDYLISFKPGTADTLLLATDRVENGEARVRRLALLVSDDPMEKLLRKARHHRLEYLTKKGIDCHSPQWSPKGDRIAYIEGNADLHVMSADGKNDKKILQGWSEPTFSWSPDGKWIAYSREDRNYNTDVWIMPAEGGESVNISRHPDDDLAPVWSADGRMIGWNTRRHGNEFDVYFTYLRRADDEISREEWEAWEKTRDKEKEKKAEKAEEKSEEGKEVAKADTFQVHIDFEDIHLRARRATTLPGDETLVAIHPKGDRIIFKATVEGKEDLFSVSRFADDLKNITSGGVSPAAAHLDKEGKTIYFLKKGVPARVGIDGGNVETTSFNARLTIDKPAERLQIMEEGWRTVGSGFYDHDLHGVDWNAVRERVTPIISHVSHDYDFADAMNIMLRSLNASHSGYYPDGDKWYNKGGYLGLEFDPAYEGNGLKVAYVLPFGPSDKEKTRIFPGDLLLTIDGMPVSSTENPFRALENREGLPTLVTIERDKKEMEYELTPVNWIDLRQIKYEEMEKVNRQITEDVSKNRVAYVHIQGMGISEVEQFELDLYAAANDKEALIIDVRSNGGGWTTDMLLTILTQPVHAYTIGRDGEIGYPQERYPLYRWEKPVAVLCDEYSYSNAEIFSHAIKTIGRGPVVGTETGGNVISTDGWTALNGAHIRLPLRGWWVWNDERHPERNNLNMEHGGCIPDYTVPYNPGDRMRKHDPQLAKAIELMIQAADQERKMPLPLPQRPR